MATATIAKTKVEIGADTTGLDKALNRAKSMATSFGSGMKTVGIAAAAGMAVATAGIVALGSKLADYVALAGVQEAAEAKLAAVLKTTGEAAGYNVEEMKKMASALQNVTTVGDETILGGQAILATFKQIRGEAFERATKAALDMSTVMGTDLNSSMVQLGKALNDPTKGLTALSRVGVSFTEQQKEQIKTLQESGDIMGAQKIILQELESEFGGAATALSKTFGGAVTQASNSMGDLKEEIGFVITKNSFFIDIAQLANEQIQHMIAYVNNNKEALQNMAKNGVVYLAESIGTVIEVMRFFENGWGGIKLAGALTFEALAIGIEYTIKGIRTLFAPLDTLADMLVSMGLIENNPFNTLTKHAKIFRESSADVRKSVLADITATNAKYDSWKAKAQEITDKIKGIGVSSVDTAEQIATATVEANQEIAESTAVASESIKATTGEALSAVQALSEAVGVAADNLSGLSTVQGSFGAADRIRYTKNTGSISTTSTYIPDSGFNLRDFNLPSFAGGGIADGPQSGYLALLHGREEVTPVGQGSSNRPINIVVEVGGQVLNAMIEKTADNIRVKAERRGLGSVPAAGIA